MSRLELAWWVVFWAAAAVALLRWPGRTLGLVTGACLWSAVGPWAAWASFGAVAAGAVAWRVSGRGRGVGLFGRPRLAVWMLSAAVSVLAPGWWVLAGLAPLMVSTWWVMASPVVTVRTERLATRRVRRAHEPLREATSPTRDAVADQAAVLVAEAEDYLRAEGDTARGPE